MVEINGSGWTVLALVLGIGCALVILWLKLLNSPLDVSSRLWRPWRKNRSGLKKLYKVTKRKSQHDYQPDDDTECPICLATFSRRSEDIGTRSGCEGDLELGTKPRNGTTTTSNTCISRLKILIRREIARVFKPVDNNEILRINQCGHTFHSRCLLTWFQKGKDDCPLCRTPYYPSTRTAAEAGLES